MGACPSRLGTREQRCEESVPPPGNDALFAKNSIKKQRGCPTDERAREPLAGSASFLAATGQCRAFTPAFPQIFLYLHRFFPSCSSPFSPLPASCVVAPFRRSAWCISRVRLVFSDLFQGIMPRQGQSRLFPTSLKRAKRLIFPTSLNSRGDQATFLFGAKRQRAQARKRRRARLMKSR